MIRSRVAVPVVRFFSEDIAHFIWQQCIEAFGNVVAFVIGSRLETNITVSGKQLKNDIFEKIRIGKSSKNFS